MIKPLYFGIRTKKFGYVVNDNNQVIGKFNDKIIDIDDKMKGSITTLTLSELENIK